MDGAALFDEYVQRKSLGLRVIGSALPLPVAEAYDRYLRRIRSLVESAKARLPRLTPCTRISCSTLGSTPAPSCPTACT